MSDWAKSDGAKIKITFDQPITAGVTGEESHFTVTVPEYNFVPNGVIGNVSKTVLSTYAGDLATEMVLEMEPLQRFESAAGNITIAYDGLGTLAGQGGPVLAFEQSFAAADLIPKPDQNDQEHVSVSMSAVGNLIRIYYTNSKEEEHIEVTMSATGKLTNVNDI